MTPKEVERAVFLGVLKSSLIIGFVVLLAFLLLPWFVPLVIPVALVLINYVLLHWKFFLFGSLFAIVVPAVYKEAKIIRKEKQGDRLTLFVHIEGIADWGGKLSEIYSTGTNGISKNYSLSATLRTGLQAESVIERDRCARFAGTNFVEFEDADKFIFENYSIGLIEVSFNQNAAGGIDEDGMRYLGSGYLDSDFFNLDLLPGNELFALLKKETNNSKGFDICIRCTARSKGRGRPIRLFLNSVVIHNRNIDFSRSGVYLGWKELRDTQAQSFERFKSRFPSFAKHVDDFVERECP